MISLRSVSKQFQQSGGAAVNDLTLDIHEGETVVLVGPSGCGKTTTMKMINRLIDPTVRARLQDEFLGIQERLRKTIVFVTHDIDEAIKMADRIAILNRGAKLEQYASPEEILRAPAGTFVEDFVGAERGLKRLALIPVSAIKVEPGPVVGPDATADEARAAIRSGGMGGGSVVDSEGDLLGWIDEPALERA